MKHSFKILFLLVLCMVLSAVCLAAPSAVTGFDTALESDAQSILDGAELSADVKGNGTQLTPYVITTPQEFNALANLVNSNTASYAGAYYQLGNNIDFAGNSLVPFGTVTVPFRGHIDGCGYGIFGIDVSDVENFGVVGYMAEGSVKNLSANYNITDRKMSKLNVFGGIVGYAYTDTQNTITVSNCDTSGNIKFNATVDVYIGGVVGRVYANRGNILFDSCVSYCNIDAGAVEGSTAGGFAGRARASSAMDFVFNYCIAYGDVVLTTTGNRNDCGGFIGFTYKDEPGWLEADAGLSETIYNFYLCIAYGDVTTSCGRTARIGGFVGKVDNPAYVKFYGNQRHMDQAVNGTAKFIELCDMVNNTYGSELYNKNFMNVSMGYNLKKVWYYNTADKRLYPRVTARKNQAATLREGASIRLSQNKGGLRFTADIEMYKRDYVSEYGFILTTEQKLADNELTFEFDGKFVSGVAYNSTTDIFFDKTDDILTFTGVLYNIPPTGYDQKVVARAYVKYTSGTEEYILYGNAVKASIKDVAAALKNDAESFANLSPEQKEIFAEMFPEN